jgi:hypothetical protein
MNKDKNVREGEDENGRKSKGTNFGGTKSYKRTAAGRGAGEDFAIVS